MVKEEINNRIETVRVALASIAGGFGNQLLQVRDAIITATSLTSAPSREVLDSKMHELREIIE